MKKVKEGPTTPVRRKPSSRLGGITPEKSLENRKRDRMENAKIVDLILSRHDESDSDAIESSRTRNVRKRLLRDAGFEHVKTEAVVGKSVESLLSVEAKPSWADSVPTMSPWWNVGGLDVTVCSDVIVGEAFLRAVVGESEKDIGRFVHWSSWNDDEPPVPTEESPVSEWVRQIMRALCRNNIDRLGTLFRLFPDTNGILLKSLGKPFGQHKRSLLHAIAMHGRVDEIVALLPTSSLECNSDEFGLTPLHLLSLNVSVESANSFTVFRGFTPEQVNLSEGEAGMLPLHAFVLGKHSVMDRVAIADCMHILTPTEVRSKRAFSENRTALMLAVGNPDSTTAAAVVESLTKTASFAIIETDLSGYTPLHLACTHGKPDLVKLLVPRIPARQRMLPCYLQGSSPLHAAAAGSSEAHADCLRLLLELVPSSELLPSLPDSQGWPPLLYALHSGSMHTIRACLEIDKKLTCPTWGGCPQLVMAMHLVSREESRLVHLVTSRRRVEKLLHSLLRVDEFVPFLNEFVKKDVSRLAGALGWVLLTPNGREMLSSENKLAFLVYRALAYTRELRSAATYSLIVPRPPACKQSRECETGCVQWLDSILASCMGGYITGQRVAVRFVSSGSSRLLEEGFGLGPTREFFSLASNIVLSHVFAPSPSGHALLPTDQPERALANQTAGRLAALSLLSGARMSFATVSPFLWQYVLEGPIGYSVDAEKLEDWDPPLARSLQSVARSDAVAADENIQLLLEGKDKYAYIAEEVRKRISPCTFEDFRIGFFQVLRSEWVEEFFSAKDLAVLMGQDDKGGINVKDWREHTVYSGGYCGESDEIEWFWRCVESMSDQEQRKLLQFATGSTSVPFGGFSQLTTAGGDKLAFTITCGGKCDSLEQPLPTASTCVNMLRLPKYPTEKILHEKLLTAIRMGSQGFTFA